MSYTLTKIEGYELAVIDIDGDFGPAEILAVDQAVAAIRDEQEQALDTLFIVRPTLNLMLSASDMRKFTASTTETNHGRKRVFLLGSKHHHGMVRMLEGLRQASEGEFVLAYERSAAADALGVPEHVLPAYP